MIEDSDYILMKSMLQGSALKDMEDGCLLEKEYYVYLTWLDEASREEIEAEWEIYFTK